jgi:hypothetical protein
VRLSTARHRARLALAVGSCTGAVPDSMPNAASLWIRPGWDQDSRIWAADRAPRPGSAATRPGVNLLDNLGDLRLEPGGLFGEGSHALAEPDQGLVQDPGLPVRAGWAGQRSAFYCAPLARKRAEPFAQRCGGGDQDRGQGGAGGLGGLDGVVPVDHQQPQRLAVPVGAHLRGVRAGQQFAGCADGVESCVESCHRDLPDICVLSRLMLYISAPLDA